MIMMMIMVVMLMMMMRRRKMMMRRTVNRWRSDAAHHDKLDHRSGTGKIASRVGLAADADTFSGDDDLFACKPCARSSSGQACSSALCSKSCCYRDPDKAAADFSGEVPTLQTSGKIEVDLGGTAVLGDFSLDPEDWK